MNSLNVYQNVSELSRGFTDFILNLSEGKHRLNIALSGGSTPKALFDHWAASGNLLPWEKLRFFWGDERCVPPQDEMSNYGMTKKHLFDKVPVPNENIFRILGENDPAIEAKRYGEVLEEEIAAHNGIPRFDLMILGLGDDGHTASIFPHEIDLWDDPQNCVVASHPETGMKRISLTGRVINNADHVVFLATGNNKAEKVRDIVLHGQAYITQYPATLVNPVSKNLFWFLDDKAAGLLP